MAHTCLVFRREAADTSDHPIDSIQGSSAAVRRLRRRIKDVAATLGTGPTGGSGRSRNILLQGETGTGKDLTAKALHQLSSRRGGTFVPVDCGVQNGEQFSSLLFGVDRGVFTGVTARDGYAQQADRGCLFLDEIGNLDFAQQAVLLRFLEDHRAQKAGEPQPKQLDLVVILATNLDLEQASREGRFRADLFARMPVKIFLPPLRERPEDLLALCEQIRIRDGMPAIPGPRLRELLDHDWPLNVREIPQVLDRLHQIGPDDSLFLVPPAGPSLPDSPSLPTAPQPPSAPSKEDLRNHFKLVDGNISELARRFGVDRQTIRRWLRKAGILPADNLDFRDQGE